MPWTPSNSQPCLQGRKPRSRVQTERKTRTSRPTRSTARWSATARGTRCSGATLATATTRSATWATASATCCSRLPAAFTRSRWTGAQFKSKSPRAPLDHSGTSSPAVGEPESSATAAAQRAATYTAATSSDATTRDFNIIGIALELCHGWCLSGRHPVASLGNPSRLHRHAVFPWQPLWLLLPPS